MTVVEETERGLVNFRVEPERVFSILLADAGWYGIRRGSLEFDQCGKFKATDADWYDVEIMGRVDQILAWRETDNGSR